MTQLDDARPSVCEVQSSTVGDITSLFQLSFFCVALPSLRAYLHGSEGLQVGVVTRLGGVTRLSI